MEACACVLCSYAFESLLLAMKAQKAVILFISVYLNITGCVKMEETRERVW